VVLLTGAVPVQAPPTAFLVAAGSSLALQQATLTALGRGRSRLVPSLVFDVVRLQANLRATWSLVRPDSGGFRVTAKGRTGDERAAASVPAVLKALLTIVSGGLVWGVLSLDGLTPTTYPARWVALVSLGWLAVTLALVLAAVRRIRDLRYGAERRDGHRFPVHLQGQVEGASAVVDDVSLGGAQVRIDGEGHLVGEAVEVTIDVTGGATPLRLAATVRSRLGAVHRLQFADDQWRALGTLSSVAFRQTILQRTDAVRVHRSAPEPLAVGD
jgi:cellulose synthase (UDP-forming)